MTVLSLQFPFPLLLHFTLWSFPIVYNFLCFPVCSVWRLLWVREAALGKKRWGVKLNLSSVSWKRGRGQKCFDTKITRKVGQGVKIECVANRSRNNFAILTLFQDSRDIIFETTRDVSINGLAISIFIAASPKKVLNHYFSYRTSKSVWNSTAFPRISFLSLAYKTAAGLSINNEEQ